MPNINCMGIFKGSKLVLFSSSFVPSVLGTERPYSVSSIVISDTTLVIGSILVVGFLLAFIYLLQKSLHSKITLEESNQRYRNLLKHLPNAICILDMQGEILIVNAASQQLLKLGLNCKVLDVCGLLNFDSQKIFKEDLLQLQSTGETITREYSVISYNGDPMDLEFTLAISPQGSKKEIILAIRDITEKNTLYRRLKNAQKMEAIGQLAGGVSHDINNILTVIEGQVGLCLAKLSTNSSIKENLTEIEAAAERAAKLIHQLLLFSRRQSLQFRSINLNDLIQDISKMLHRLLGEHIELKPICDSHLPPIWGDVGMMEQVVINLAVNARDAMPKGGKLLIRTETVKFQETDVMQSEAVPGEYVCLEVTDTGCGMDEETQRHIFEPFFSTKEPGKGTGLGLATVNGIVKQHEGWIEVFSLLNKGTTFKVFIPRSEQSVTNSERKASRQMPTGNETILLVEDEESVREMVTECLSRQGYDVIAARTGPEALTCWQHHRTKIDLLLTDLVMPDGIMGHELAERLQQDKPDLKVIFTTGYSQELSNTIRTNCSLEEGRNYLPKPYHPSELAQFIRKCLDNKEPCIINYGESVRTDNPH